MIAFVAVFLLFQALNAAQAPCPTGWIYKSHANACYLVPKVKLPFAEANNYCKSKGGALVSLKNKEIYEIVQEVYNTESSALYPPWIGLRKDNRYWWGDWMWPDGLHASYTKWLPGEPKDKSDDACVAWRTLDNGGWKTLGCQYAQSFICQQHSANCATTQFTKPDGIITSSNYPLNYDNNLNCFYHVKVKEGFKIRIEFTDFYTETNYDTVTLYDDYTGNASNVIDTLSGFYLPKKIFETSENVLTIQFKTDFAINKKGWNATYTSVHHEPTEVIDKQKGTLTSKNYPANYPNDVDHLYQINALPDQVIKITITDFDVELKYDYLSIQDGSDIVESPVLAKITGRNETTPRVIYTTKSSALIRFFTDPVLTYKGWSLNFEAVDRF